MVLALTVNTTRQSPERQPHSSESLERVHITDASFRERFHFEIDLRARRRGQFSPLADGGRGKLDLFHESKIAQCDGKIKQLIA